MNDLRELIGQTVTATITEDEKGNGIDIKCKIIDLHIEDYYFQDKGEPIYIQVNVEPIGELPKGVYNEDLSDIYLDCIRK
jgi:hypothetical protein|tara:strand:+ start:32 stop:271 length:240 start_codon:yes stop_codon:yes gene_type:complete